jgi:hypothetical protein
MKLRQIQFLPDTVQFQLPLVLAREKAFKGAAMSSGHEVMAVRQEILDLLRQQMDALDSPQGLTEEQLRECYDRQTRVQELREKLEAASNAEREISATPGPVQAIPVSAECATDHHAA